MDTISFYYGWFYDCTIGGIFFLFDVDNNFSYLFHRDINDASSSDINTATVQYNMIIPVVNHIIIVDNNY